MRTGIPSLLAACLAVLAAPGCYRAGGGEEARTYIGIVENSDAFVALVRVEDAVLAYVCDGRATAAWFRGDAEGRTFEAASGEGRLRAEFDDLAARGVFVSEEGGAYGFTAWPATGGAGFYRAAAVIAGSAYVGGWILLGGQQRGAVTRDGVVVDEAGFDPARPVVPLPGGPTLTALPADAATLVESGP